jgi:hypothetical protein
MEDQTTPGDGDYTAQDEEKMDRAAQAGTSGAFGAGDSTSGVTDDNMRQDAEEAFGGAGEQSES